MTEKEEVVVHNFLDAHSNLLMALDGVNQLLEEADSLFF